MRKVAITLGIILIFTTKFNAWQNGLKLGRDFENRDLIFEGTILYTTPDTKNAAKSINQMDEISYVLVNKVIKGNKAIENDVIRYIKFEKTTESLRYAKAYYSNESIHGVFLLNKIYPIVNEKEQLKKTGVNYIDNVNWFFYYGGEIGTDESEALNEMYNIKKGIPAFDTVFNTKDDLVKWIENSLEKRK